MGGRAVGADAAPAPAPDPAAGVRFDGTRFLRAGPDGVEVELTDPAELRDAAAALLRAAQQRGFRTAVLDPAHMHGAATVFARDPNPPAFVAAVDELLAPDAERFNAAERRASLLDVDRFVLWAGVVDAAHPVAGARVLASGCAAGGSLLAYAALGAREVVGLEVEADLERLARLRTEGLPGVTTRLYDGDTVPYPDAHFEVVESLDVVEHTADPQAYLREIARVLAPGGVAVVAIPNRLYPVEQHTGVPLVPWLPLRLVDRAVTAYAELPGMTFERAFRVLSVRSVRTCNVSWRALVRMAGAAGMTATRVHAADHASNWPFDRDAPWVERLARLPRGGASVAPTRQLVAVLRRAGAGGAAGGAVA